MDNHLETPSSSPPSMHGGKDTVQKATAAEGSDHRGATLTSIDIQDSRYKGYAVFKEDALLDYEFSIAIENSKEDYYISEKFTDCFMNNCVPIYDGCNLTHEFYNPQSFEKIDIEADNAIDTLRIILKNTNEKYAESVQQSKIKYFTDYNIYTYLKKCI